jgi:hypothetical protein
MSQERIKLNSLINRRVIFKLRDPRQRGADVTKLSTWGVLLLLASSAHGKTISIKVTVGQGVPLKDVLIIVRSTTNGSEQGRFLSDVNGDVPPIQIGSGLEQIIATCPYGLCQPVVQEIVGESAPASVVVEVPLRPTDELGSLVGAREVELVFTGPDKAGLNLFVRDKDAIRETWYKTDREGRAKVQLVDPQTRVLLVEGGTIYRYLISDKCAGAASDPTGYICVKNENGTVAIAAPKKQ